MFLKYCANINKHHTIFQECTTVDKQRASGTKSRAKSNFRTYVSVQPTIAVIVWCLDLDLRMMYNSPLLYKYIIP